MRAEITVFIIVFSLGTFLVCFPGFGPASLNLIEAMKIDFYTFFAIYFIFDITGSISSFFVLDGIAGRITTMKVLSISLITSSIATYYFPLAIALVGYFFGFSKVTMGSILARSIKPWHRGRILGLGSAIAFFIMAILNYAAEIPVFQLIIISVAPLLLIFLLPESRMEVLKERRINYEFTKFVVPVFILYILYGVVNASMEPIFEKEGIKIHLFLIAGAIILAGYLYDTAGRRIITVAGMLMLAVSFELFSINHLLSASLSMIAFGFLNIFAMLIWADLAYYGSEARQYAVGTVFIPFSILSGLIIAQKFLAQNPDINIASILLVISAVIIASVKEPRLTPEEYVRWASKVVED